MVAFETIDDVARFLHDAGWSVSEAKLLFENGDCHWLVTAMADGHEVWSEADSQIEAWRAAGESVAEQTEW